VDGTRSLPCDLADEGAIAGMWDEYARQFDRLDVLVHCAGVTRDAVLWKLPPADWRTVMAVNLDSAFHLLRGAVPWMRQGGGGSVVLVTSINGERGKLGQSAYAASKAGLIGLGRTAARELGRFGIRVNLVSPGLVATPMTADLPPAVVEQALAESVLGRAGEPDDVAQAILFLAADGARHVTGQVLRVDGGQLIA
jgi:NAD(P)-dependent dehydrogenase (short-subunit alcohol dehydrogenase family)